VSDRCDYLIVGGGLAGGLIALALRQTQPHATVTVLERDDRPAGNHTWAFHAEDVPPAADNFVRPLLVANWPGYRVRFPGCERDVPSPYAAISAEGLATALEQGDFVLRTRAEAVTVTADRVEMADGTVLSGRCVIDARGLSGDWPPAAGFQKFVGLEVETDQPWPHVLPTVMDADVAQEDGYRFLYVLPFRPTRVMVEDTYFSDSPYLDRPRLRRRVGEYLQSRGVHSWQVIREEAGVLPMPWAGRQIRVEPNKPLLAGYAGGWFHPATGYSLPLAVRLALTIATVPPEKAGSAAAALAQRLAPRQRFGRFLNRLLFTLVKPDQRWQVFRRLYRSLPDALMNRFYAGEFGCVDAGRLLLGWPPPLSPSRLFHRPEVRPCPQPSP
jgi:lycopene beta-cyclase